MLHVSRIIYHFITKSAALFVLSLKSTLRPLSSPLMPQFSELKLFSFSLSHPWIIGFHNRAVSIRNWAFQFRFRVIRCSYFEKANSRLKEYHLPQLGTQMRIKVFLSGVEQSLRVVGLIISVFEFRLSLFYGFSTVIALIASICF